MTALVVQSIAAPLASTDSTGLYYNPASAVLSGSMQNGDSSTSVELQRTDFPSGQAPLAATQNDSGRSYTILKEVGDGSFGTVWLADWHSSLNLPPGTRPPGPSNRPEYVGKKLVAIKRMKKAFNGGWEECMKLKELRSLRTIPMHPNIIPLYDAFLMPSSKELYFVFECMEGNLYQLTKSRKMRPLAGGLVATLFYQMLSGLHHIHQSGFFHRDMKPENVLITTTGLADYPNCNPSRPASAPPERDVEVIVKLADFGLARETLSSPPYTEYVSTRWYRAPEVLLRDREYSNPVDMWALGTILAEMITLKPMFPGGTEVDQVHRICEVLGDPSDKYTHSNGVPRGGGPWNRGIKLAKLVHFEFLPMKPIDFRTLFDLRIVPIQLVDCIFLLLRFDPRLRLTTTQCLQHPYFSEIAARLHPVATGTPAPTQLPPTPNSVGGYTAAHYVASNQAQAILSPPQSGVLDTTASRQVPPSHSHGTPAPSPEYAHGGGDLVGRTGTTSSTGSGSLPLGGISYYRGNSDHSDSYRQSIPRSVYSDSWPSASTHPVNQFAAGPLPVPAFRQPRLSTAASTFYDGSIFEGIAPTREASIMSFNMYGAQETAASRYAAAYQQRMSNTVYDDDMQPAHAGPSLTAAAAPRSTHLKRTPSERSQNQPEPGAAAPAPPLDPKKAKKEAEKAAKEAERAKREVAQRVARERARAVMQKKSQLEQKSAGQTSDALNMLRPATKVDTTDKGKGRGGSTLPNIAEHGYAQSTVEGRSNGGRFKLRRRDDDDDVHSVSSNETRNSNERLKTSGTTDSDQGVGRLSWPIHHPHLLGKGSSVSGMNYPYGPPPGSSSSSVDDRLAKTFQGLTAAEAPMEHQAVTIGQAMHPRYFVAPSQPHLPFLPQMAFPPDGPGKSLPSYQLSRTSSQTNVPQ